jgi:hypothetical protein
MGTSYFSRYIIPVKLKLTGVFVLPKIAKGVEGGGDLSVCMLVYLIKAKNTMKTMTPMMVAPKII